MSLKQNFVAAPTNKIMINIGALLDIPVGFYVKGKYGESILNGGLGFLTGVVGIGNNFKSTLLNYMMLSALDRITSAVESSASTYDTEVNIHESALKRFISRFANLCKLDILMQGIWVITDKTVYYGDQWYTMLKDYLAAKKAGGVKNMVTTPFLDRDGKTLQRILIPTFGAVDSFSAFETSNVAKIHDENALGDAGGNTMHMRQGLAKMQFMMEMPNVSASAYHYTLLTAHIGKDIQMASGPMPAPPTKKLQYLKNGDKVKGVTDQFFFLMSNCYQAYNAAPLLNNGTKGPEYPRSPEDDMQYDTDLNVVSVRQLRSKSGPSGLATEIIVSQSEGVLPSLTEFHFIKNSDRFGISGTLQHYSLDLLPDVKLSRTTVRSKIDSDPKLRRALNITAELCQMDMLWHHLKDGRMCTPKELYDDLKAKGYEWDTLLSTRGWWTIDNDSPRHAEPFLSTMDLLNIKAGTYFPFWLDENKKVKSEYKK